MTGFEKLENIGFKFPEKMIMAHWNKITPITKKLETQEVTEIEGVIEMYKAVNIGNAQNNKIYDEIMNMDIGEFENISGKISEFIQSATPDKKK